MPFLEGANEFTDLTFFDIAGGSLVTIDAENVLTNYGDSTIRDEALVIIDGWRSLRKSPHLAVATNNRDPGYIADLKEQLPDSVPVLSGIDYESKKTSDEMFLAAAAMFNVNPEEAIHIDDQLLSFRGARMAGYMRGILVKPYGGTSHKGVKLGRALDYPVRTTLNVVQGINVLRTDGIDG